MLKTSLTKEGETALQEALTGHPPQPDGITSRRSLPRQESPVCYCQRRPNRAERTGVPEKVFCASMADVFEDHPDLEEPRKRPVKRPKCPFLHAHLKCHYHAHLE